MVVEWPREILERPDRFGNRPEGYPGIETVHYDPDDVIVPSFLPDTPSARAELAQYYQAVSRIDTGWGYFVKRLQEAGVYDNTLIICISDHGIAMPGAKTTVYEPGLRSPCLVRLPGGERRGTTSEAMISWADLTPTLLDFAGLLDRESGTVPAELADRPTDIHQPGSRRVDYRFHGRSFMPVLRGQHSEGWDKTYASHTFHEIQMYYPMRVVRTRRYKLIWNVAHQLPFPFASDLWVAPTWQRQYEQGISTPYGERTVGEYIHRPEFELYDLEQDPGESNNLAVDAQHQAILRELQADLKEFQERTEDPWKLKWEYE